MTNVLTPRNALGAVSIPDGVAGPSRCARFPTIADDSVGLIHAQGPLGAALLLTLCVSTLFAQPITITAGNATAKRQAILTRIFGSASLPTALPTTITTDVGPPADLTPAGILLANLERVDRLEFSMSGRADNVEEKNIAYHLIPLRKNNRLVVLNPGHACSYVEQLATDPTSDYGYGDLRTLNGLLREGYSVLATYMPHSSNCCR